MCVCRVEVLQEADNGQPLCDEIERVFKISMRRASEFLVLYEKYSYLFDEVQRLCVCMRVCVVCERVTYVCLC